MFYRISWKTHRLIIGKMACSWCKSMCPYSMPLINRAAYSAFQRVRSLCSRNVSIVTAAALMSAPLKETLNVSVWGGFHSFVRRWMWVCSRVQYGAKGLILLRLDMQERNSSTIWKKKEERRLKCCIVNRNVKMVGPRSFYVELSWWNTDWVCFYLVLQSVVLHQADVECRRPAFSSLQHQTNSLACLCWEAMGFDGGIQRLLGHGPVGGPLPTCTHKTSTLIRMTRRFLNSEAESLRLTDRRWWPVRCHWCWQCGSCRWTECLWSWGRSPGVGCHSTLPTRLRGALKTAQIQSVLTRLRTQTRV